MRSAGSGLALSVTCGDRFPLLSLRDIFPRRGGSLSSKGGASGETAHFAFEPETLPPCQGLSLWERWICEAKTERARTLPEELPLSVQISSHENTPAGCSAVRRPSPSRENAMPGGPQTARHCSIQIIFPLKMRRATRRAFQIVLAIAASAHHLTADWLSRSDCGCDAPASPPQRCSRRHWGR